MSKQPENLCYCGKIQHKSKGAANAQVRALVRAQEEGRRKDWKDRIDRLMAFRAVVCEQYYHDGIHIWHVGHR